MDDIKTLNDDQAPVVELMQRAGVTPEQVAALFRKWKQQDQGMPWRDFAATVTGPHSMLSGCLLVQWCGMTLGIETDGYAHS